MNEDRLLNLRYWLDVLSRYRWLIIGCVGGVASVAAFFSLQLTPIYKGTSTLYLAAPQVKTLTFEEVYTEERMRPQERLLTRIQMIGSTPVLARAVRSLEEKGLMSFDSPEPLPDPTLVNRLMALLSFQEEEPETPEVTPNVRRARYVRRLKRRIDFVPIGTGSFLKVGVRDRAPKRAAQLANAIAQSYVESSKDLLRKGADDAVAWLEGKLEEQKARLAEAEKGLRENTTAGSAKVDDVGQMVVRELTLLQEGLMDIRLRIMAEESRQAVINADTLEGEEPVVPILATRTVEDEVADALRDRVRSELIDISVELDQLKQRLGDRHPDVIQAMDKKKRLEDQLADMPLPTALNIATVDPADPNARVPVEMLRAQEQALTANLDRALTAISSQGAQGSKAEIFRREVDIQRKIYSQMLSRKNEIILSAKLDSSVAEVFERAVPRPFPVSPNHTRTLLIAIVGGFILGLGIALVRDHLDQSVRDPDQAFGLMKAPVLGMIPFDSRMKKLKPNAGQTILSERGVHDSRIEEAYQVLRSHIEGAHPNGRAEILLVTSAVPGEGKSTTAANLAAAFADAGDRILLVDGDFRRPSIGRYFNLELKGDLSDVLLGKICPEQAVHRDDSSMLDIIATRPGGDIPQGARLTQTFQALFTWARQHYDRVIVDMPVVMVPISAEVSRAGASAVLVHRPGFASVKVLTQVREHLTMSKIPLLGVVLNGVRMAWLGDNYPLLYHYYSSAGRPPRKPRMPDQRPDRQLTE